MINIWYVSSILIHWSVPEKYSTFPSILPIMPLLKILYHSWHKNWIINHKQVQTATNHFYTGIYFFNSRTYSSYEKPLYGLVSPFSSAGRAVVYSHLPLRLPFSLRINPFSYISTVRVFIVFSDFPMIPANSFCVIKGFFSSSLRQVSFWSTMSSRQISHY